MLETSLEVCLARAAERYGSGARLEQAAEWIASWWERYEPSDFDEVVRCGGDASLR